ncbi:uncharacterized protein JCM6883_006678 [Sporobolomyces salmoneus]|uniref:uncharacterized protein n=1 Tax=Sporobolomyces salmoneus TaxID=183962 RepID=UPI003179A572
MSSPTSSTFKRKHSQNILDRYQFTFTPPFAAQTSSSLPFFRHPSGSPHSRNPSERTVLPPELIQEIIDQIPLHPQSERTSTLLNLCPVSHSFLDLVRPILYREIHLFLESPETGKKRHVSFRKLCRTLLGTKDCAKLVKSVKISLEGFERKEMIKLDKVFRNLVALESIRTEWKVRKSPQGEIVEYFVSIIRKNGRRIRTLELPMIEVKRSIFNSLPNLEKFVGFVENPDSLNYLSSKSIQLHRLFSIVYSAPLSYSLLLTLLSPFSSTLTSLSFVLQAPTTSDSPLNLSGFFALKSLRLLISHDTLILGFLHSLHPSLYGVGVLWSTESPSLAFLENLRRILESAKCLPALRVFGFSTCCDRTAKILAQHPLLDLLPESIERVGTFPEMILSSEEGGPNSTLLFETLETRPSFRRIDLLPSSLSGTIDPDEMYELRQRVRERLRKKGIEEVSVGGPEKGKGSWALGLDPRRWEIEEEGARWVREEEDEEKDKEESNEDEGEVISDSDEYETARREHLAWRERVVRANGMRIGSDGQLEPLRKWDRMKEVFWQGIGWVLAGLGFSLLVVIIVSMVFLEKAFGIPMEVSLWLFEGLLRILCKLRQ